MFLLKDRQLLTGTIQEEIYFFQTLMFLFKYFTSLISIDPMNLTKQLASSLGIIIELK